MIKKIWHGLGNLKLAFWLLIAASAILFTGSIYANSDFSFFQTLNETRIQDWLSLRLRSHFHLVWWLPTLFIIMGLLGVNIFICAVNRLKNLFSQRKKMQPRLFLVRLAPSLIHLLFIVVLLGHVLTFSGSTWERVPIKEGEMIHFNAQPERLHVNSIWNTYYPENSGLKDRIAQTTVVLSDPAGKEIKLSYLSPVHYNGSYLLLDMIKKKKNEIIKEEEKSPASTLMPDGETCNKAHIFHTEQKKNDQKLLLLRVSDPGRVVIIPGLTVILITMAVYFIALPEERENGV